MVTVIITASYFFTTRLPIVYYSTDLDNKYSVQNDVNRVQCLYNYMTSIFLRLPDG